MLDKQLKELRQEIKSMTHRQNIYKVLKQELSLLGYWKNKPRGNPSAGGIARQKLLRSNI